MSDLLLNTTLYKDMLVRNTDNFTQFLGYLDWEIDTSSFVYETKNKNKIANRREKQTSKTKKPEYNTKNLQKINKTNKN